MIKKCHRCGVTKTFEHLGRDICSRCFVQLIEKRVKKSLSGAFSKDERVLVDGELAEYFVSKINIPLKIAKKGRHDKKAVGRTMDDIDADFLARFFGKEFKVLKDDKVIDVLSVVTDEEAMRLAKIKGLKFEVSGENKVLKDFLKRISKKHPEVRFNLLRNVKEVEEILS